MIDLSDGFRGFARTDGPPGVRNHLLVLSVCGLNASGARRVAAALPGAVLVSTMFGRGQVGDDRALHDRMLIGFGRHPNVGGVLLMAPDDAVGDRIAGPIRASSRPCHVFSLQTFEEDGTGMAAAAAAVGRELAASLAEAERRRFPASRLILATECGHSDASSGMVANPALGLVADALVAAGGRVLVSETLEWTGTEAVLRARAASAAVADRLDAMLRVRHATARAAGLDVYLGNPGPQNHAGGLTTLEEKSMGAVTKGGSGPIVGALEHGAGVPDASGLYFMDTPTLSPESVSAMVAGGAQVVVFTTGQGNPYASALAPTLKTTGNPQTASRRQDQIDVDVSAAFRGDETVAASADRLATGVLATASGRTTCAERAGEGEEAISRLLPSI